MSIRKDLPHIRTDYQKGILKITDLLENPINQFERWFSEALQSGHEEANAMTLATTRDGRPSARIVLLKGFDENGFVFFTNYQSRKGQELIQNPFAALNFFWPFLERQIRIEGQVEKISPQDSDTYFHSRNRESRIGAWASPQSQKIESRNDLEERVEKVAQQFEGQEPFPRPEYWGGFRLVPDYIEFWQGRKSRLHDRFVYEKGASGDWEIGRLAP